jgi:hypothetical protein
LTEREEPLFSIERQIKVIVLQLSVAKKCLAKTQVHTYPIARKLVFIGNLLSFTGKQLFVAGCNVSAIKFLKESNGRRKEFIDRLIAAIKFLKESSGRRKESNGRRKVFIGRRKEFVSRNSPAGK